MTSSYEKKSWLRATLPDGWEVDESEEPLALYHPDGPGALQVTVQALRPRTRGEKIDMMLMLRGYLHSIGRDIDTAEVRRYADRGMEWAACEYGVEDPGEGRVFWRLWMATNDERVAFLTYACPEPEKEAERAAVDEILASFEFA